MASNPPPGPNGPYSAIPANAPNVGGGGIMPSAGHYADMQTLMQNLDALSGWLQQNREDFDGLQENLRRVEGMNGSRAGGGLLGRERGLGLENGVEGEEESQIAKLQQELQQSRQRITHLESTLSSFQTLHALFTSTLSETMRLIRTYTFTQQTYITSLHHHYTRLLQDARYETLEAQTTHQKWQEGLARVSESCREASKAREEEAEEGGLMAEVRGLRYENRLLRRKVGWKERAYTELEEEEIEEERRDEERKLGRERERDGRGSLSLGLGEGVGVGVVT